MVCEVAVFLPPTTAPHPGSFLSDPLPHCRRGLILKRIGVHPNLKSKIENLKFPVVLASASPRRRELLSELVPSFEVRVSDVDEDVLTTDDPWATAEALALAKARAVAAGSPEALVIGGDTVVALPASGHSAPFVQLAKPFDADDARRMLRELSGKEHAVITGVALVSPDGDRVKCDTTWVRFKVLCDEEINAYVATEEPMDKAGAYAIQGGAAGFVEGIEGSRSNVIGLPVEMLREMLEEMG